MNWIGLILWSRWSLKFIQTWSCLVFVWKFLAYIVAFVNVCFDILWSREQKVSWLIKRLNLLINKCSFAANFQFTIVCKWIFKWASLFCGGNIYLFVCLLVCLFVGWLIGWLVVWLVLFCWFTLTKNEWRRLRTDCKWFGFGSTWLIWWRWWCNWQILTSYDMAAWFFWSFIAVGKWKLIVWIWKGEECNLCLLTHSLELVISMFKFVRMNTMNSVSGWDFDCEFLLDIWVLIISFSIHLFSWFLDHVHSVRKSWYHV